MDELDKKLKEAVAAHRDSSYSPRPFVSDAKQWEIVYNQNIQDGLTSSVSQIKQAFIDAGWLSPERVDEIGEKQLDFGHRWGMMTGQEWYARFEKELEKSNPHKGTFPEQYAWETTRTYMLPIAQKASGITQ